MQAGIQITESDDEYGKVKKHRYPQGLSHPVHFNHNSVPDQPVMNPYAVRPPPTQNLKNESYGSEEYYDEEEEDINGSRLNNNDMS